MEIIRQPEIRWGLFDSCWSVEFVKEVAGCCSSIFAESNFTHYFCTYVRHSTSYQRLFSLFLLLAFFIQTFSTSWVLADYYTNTGKYAADCENKQKPELKCKGKCQMMKKIKEEEQKDNDNPERKAETKAETSVYFRSAKALIPAFDLESKGIPRYFSYTEGSILHRSTSVFHPPRMS